MIINNQGHCGAFIQVIWDELMKAVMALSGGGGASMKPAHTNTDICSQTRIFSCRAASFPESRGCRLIPALPSSLQHHISLLGLFVTDRGWDTGPVLTFSISRARVPLGQTVTPDRAKWQSNASHVANQRNLLAALQAKRVCAKGPWCDSFGVAGKQLSARKESVPVHMCASARRWVGNVSGWAQGSLGVHGECLAFWLSLSHPSCTHLTMGSAWLWGGTPAQCIWISHTCPVASAGHGRRNEATGAKEAKARQEALRDSWLLAFIYWLFILLDVKFICQLSILCFVSLLYAQYKVTINSIWECIKNISAKFCHIFPFFFRHFSGFFLQKSAGNSK